MARGAVAEALFDLLTLDERGHENDRDVREIGSRVHRVSQLEAVHLGHRHVAEDYVRTDPFYEAKALLPVLRNVNVVGR